MRFTLAPVFTCRRAVFWLLLVMLAGCYLQPTPSADPTAGVPPALTPTPVVVQPNGWQPLAPGLELRTYTPSDAPFGEIVALRIDPALYVFRAHYRPGDPLGFNQWRELLPEAAAFVNANFFDPQFRILGLLVADGIAHGQAYTNRGGMLAVQNGQPRVRSNTREPYQGEPLEQAVQGFPMLVLDGQAIFTNTEGDRITRRTAVGQDDQGRIILMATPQVGITLVGLSAYLPTTDMGLVQAFNLDGGGSTMMYAAPGPLPYRLLSLDAVPAVLAVYPR